MASGNNGSQRCRHPSRGEDGQHRRSSLPLNSEENVAQQTADVFRSYAFYRYQQEQNSLEDMIVDPEIAELPEAQSTTTVDVGRRLAVIGDDINMRYECDFREMLQTLQPDMDNAYTYFTKIASSLFEDGINWGRVIALLGFGYRMAIHVYHHHGIRGFFSRITQFVAEFVLCNRIAQWIAQQGGWVAAMDLDNIYFKYVLITLVVVLTAQFALRRFFNR